MVKVSKQQDNSNAQIDGVGNTAAHLLHIPCAERLGNWYTKAATHSQYKADNQKVEGARRPHSSQGIDSYELSYDDAVRHVIKLLKQISRNQRKTKRQNQPQRLAGSHIFDQIRIPSYISIFHLSNHNSCGSNCQWGLSNFGRFYKGRLCSKKSFAHKF